MAKLSTLKKRQDFLALKQKGKRVSMPHFLVQACDTSFGEVRWGFIITKKIGNAVVRHRIRRRLKEIIRVLPADLLLHSADYVVIPKTFVANETFSILHQQMEHALYKMAKLLKT